MVHFIIINWFNWSGFCIWNRFIIRFNWKIWRVNLNITIINGTMIKSHCDSWNPITGFGGRGPGFEVSFLRLDVLLSWCLSCLITMMGVESVHIYSKTWWGQFRVMDDAGIILVSDSSTELSNTLLSHAESLNNWLGSFCIIFGGRLRTKMTIALTWIGQCSWVSNNFYITIESMNIPPCVCQFPQSRAHRAITTH